MAARTSTLTCLASVAMLAFLSTASAAQPQPGAQTTRQAQPGKAALATAAKAESRERAQLAKDFANKWGTYVARMYDVPKDVWTDRMAPGLAAADASNLRNAMQRDTFEGAMAELSGVGARMSDDKAIDLLAASGGSATPQTLGSLANDLVYTPLQPCRILDTRSAAAGSIAANSTRNFIAVSSGNFTVQGGSATNCGTSGLNATAVAINLTAVAPIIGGYATAYPYGTTLPVASSLNYSAGAIVNNALIVQIPNPLSSYDFSLYTFAQSHYVADIVGYFSPPQATALQCIETADTVLSVVAGATANATAPACTAGYTQTATNCESSTWKMPFVFFQSGTCSAQNNDTVTASLRASRTCCRVPGR